MNKNEFLPDAVQWSEGMLLSPQHFQQNDIHAQAVLHQRLLGLSPHCWGVRQLVLDDVRLSDGLIKIIACDAVMPDGLPVLFRADNAGFQLQLDVSGKCSSDGRPLRVFLALPPRVGASLVHSTSIRRYESLPGTETLDEVTGIGDVLVERQRARLELFTEGALPADYASVPLLDVIIDSHGNIALGDFHPPMFRIGASAFLGDAGLQQKFAQLRSDMWKKFRELIGTFGDDAPEAAAVMGTEGRMHLRVAREIAACLPLIDALLSDPLYAPAQAWQVMAQIVGRVTAIGANPRPLAMDPYNHIDCIGQFKEALEFVKRKLMLINSEWDSLAFARVSEGMFARRLPEDSSQTVYIELRAREGQTSRDLNAWLAEARIASENLLPVLRERRLPGADWSMLSSREVAELGLRADAMVCKLSSQRLELPKHGMVDTFSAGRSLVVQGDAGRAPAAILLHHRKPTRRNTAHGDSVMDKSHG